MALTQIQKNLILKMKNNPEGFLQDIQNDKNLLNTFKDEYFQDGQGLLHIVIQSYHSDPATFKKIIEVISLNSNLSFEDYKGRTSSPLQELTTQSSDIKENFEILYLILKNNYEKMSDLGFNHAMKVFSSESKYYQVFADILDKRVIKNDYNWPIILQNFIKNDNLELVKKVLSKNTALVSELPYVVPKSVILGSQSTQRQEASNLLIFTQQYSSSISHFFLDNFNFPLDGKIKLNSYSPIHYNYTSERNKVRHFSISALAQAYSSNDYDMFIKVWRKEPHLKYLTDTLEAKRELSQQVNQSYDNQWKPNSKLFEIIAENHKFYSFIRQEIMAMENFKDNKLLSIVLGCNNISLKEKLALTKHIIPHLENEKLEKNTMLSIFFMNLYSKPINNEDISHVGEIFALIHNDKKPSQEYISLDIVRLPLLNNSQLLQTLIANGLELNKNNGEKINPFTHYYNLTKNFKPQEFIKFFQQVNTIELQKNFDTLKLLYPEDIRLEMNAYNLLEYGVYSLDMNILKNLKDNEIKYLSQEKDIVKILKIPSIDNITCFHEVCQFLYEKDISFFKNNESFYKVLNNCTDYDLLDKILLKENKSIKQLSENVEFWYYIDKPELAAYVAQRDANYDNSSHIRMLYNSKAFNYYVEHGGSVAFKDPSNNNILHTLIKEECYEEASFLLKKHPYLAQEINDQKKIPLSYMIVNFNKHCLDNHNKTVDRYSKKFNAILELFNTYLEVGQFNKDIKSQKFIEAQIEKYSHIEKIIPNIHSIISYKKMDINIPQNTTIIKKRKI